MNRLSDFCCDCPTLCIHYQANPVALDWCTRLVHSTKTTNLLRTASSFAVIQQLAWEKKKDLTRPMAASPPRHLCLKAVICALDVVAASEVGFAAFIALGALGDSETNEIFGADQNSRSGTNRGVGIIAALLCIGALAGLVFALEMWCARSCMTPGKNAVYFFLVEVVVVVIVALSEVHALIALLAVVPPLVGCGLSVYYRSLLRREHPSPANAEATLMAELVTAENSGTAYSRGVTGILRVEHPTLTLPHAENPEPSTQKDAAPHFTAERV
jgi:hypothetical protein